MMALAGLVSLRALPEEKKDASLAELSVPEVRRLLEVALPLPADSPEFKLAWSRWRRARHLQARLSHYRARKRKDQQKTFADSS